MNPYSEFLNSNLVAVFFIYGLAFFVLGIVLLISRRRKSAFGFTTVLLPFALFGLLHGIHEWFEMFQMIGTISGAYTLAVWHEVLRVILLTVSFVMLLLFALLLLQPATVGRKRIYMLVGMWLVIWALVTLVIAAYGGYSAMKAIATADVLARFMFGIPAALLAAWALMSQQRIIRDSDMPQFGANLVWCAVALVLYSLVGQVFVRPGALPDSYVLTSANFLAWFGMPVQLFRAAMAVILTFFMLRVLGVFEAEEKRRLYASNQAKLVAQAKTLETEQRTSQQLKRINDELQQATQKLSLLVEISNTLHGRNDWPAPLVMTLQLIMDTLVFAKAGLILLQNEVGGQAQVTAEVGYEQPELEGATQQTISRSEAIALGNDCIKDGMAHCIHVDGARLSFTLEEALQLQECRRYKSPTLIVALPLNAGHRTIGSLVLANDPLNPSNLSVADLSLTVGIAQELGLSVQNALLQRQAQEREKMLSELLGTVVDAQEGERHRIARELHDATGQSLTAIALGLRGVETQLRQVCAGRDSSALLRQIDDVQSFSTNALRELHAIIADLRPPQLDELGLLAAMRWYIRAYEERWGIDIQFTATGDDSALSDDYKTVLFRIFQEALINIAKHAEASRIEIGLENSESEVLLTVKDDGRGFDLTQITGIGKEQSGWGLVGMSERVNLLGGSLDISTAIGQGTIIEVRIPYAIVPVMADLPYKR